jgi:DNA replication and repair protein RecF
VLVRSLSLTDFRSWSEVDLELEPGATALVGANGQGKTNLVEALGYVATLGSHRVAADAPLVRAGADRAVVRTRVARDGRDTLVEIEINPGRANRARLNRSPVPRAREVLGVLRTVLFAPEDLALVRGDPSERRRFLDDLLVAGAPRYAAVRADYERVLKQRNALLKTAFHATRAKRSGSGSGADMRTLDVWDSHLARTGAELLAARLSLVEALRPEVARAYRDVSDGQGEAGMTYRSSLDRDAGDRDTDRDTDRNTDRPTGGGTGATDQDVLAAALLSELARVRSAEIERGVSLVGPHRDELVLSLGDLPVRGYASHGEGWSVALALRLASYALLKADAAGDGEPVLVLDDVFAELDTGRRDRLAELVSGAAQVLVTAAVPADVPEALVGSRYDVHDGKVLRVR